jgi:signal transduction histidine kinase
MAGYDFLRKVELFAELPEEDLMRLCEVVEEVHLPAGEELFAEGSPGDMAYVIEDGQVEILKSSDGRKVQLAVRQSGEVIGEMALLESMPRNATGRALTDSVLLAISRQQLDDLLDSSPMSARVMLHTVTQRLRSTELLLRQSEKMAQLGTLTAGVAHELNNPAAAARRGADQLRSAFAAQQQLQVRLYGLSLSEPQQAALLELDRQAGVRAAQPAGLDTLQRSDQESVLEDWLEDNSVENGWELAPQLAGLGYDPAELDRLAGVFPGDALGVVLGWLGITFTIYSLLEEIGQGTTRISEIVKALKSYAYLDQAPVQAVDVHEGLDNTLVMLRSKLKAGVSVHRQYAADMPRIQAYGSELNQVWTNIIDNAVDAMDGKGEITIRTRQEKDCVVVEIEDNGPGIPESVQSKIFDPFFTTKPVGKGTGLGLNISYNIIKKHQGDIKVVSHPGMTRFVVTLPLDFEQKR